VLLRLQALSLLLVAFPLMGLNPGPGWFSTRAPAEVLRVVSYNISFGG
jgi:hypothetical protein